jgi:predicted CXXCH cytochrome family protein
MKARHIMRTFCLLAAIALGSVLPGLSQEDIQIVEDSGFKTVRRPAAVFLHDDHNDTAGIDDCSTCHHVYEDGVKLEDETSEDSECSECHMAEGSTDSMPLMRTYHDRCKGCHQERQTGPVMCGECHRRDG